jgi:hypothetical protein
VVLIKVTSPPFSAALIAVDPPVVVIWTSPETNDVIVWVPPVNVTGTTSSPYSL